MIDTKHQRSFDECTRFDLIVAGRKRLAGLDAAIAVAERIAAGIISAHQVAVNSLVELALSTPDFCKTFPDVEPTIPLEQVPAFFRLAIEEANTAGRQFSEETAILEYGLTFIDQNGGDANIRTPKQEEFYADLLIRRENEEFRVSYSPSSLTIN